VVGSQLVQEVDSLNNPAEGEGSLLEEGTLVVVVDIQREGSLLVEGEGSLQGDNLPEERRLLHHN